MTKSTDTTITLIIAKQEITFEPNMVAYNGMINDMAMDNKIAPVVTYLRRIVKSESKTALDELLAIPGAAMQIAEKVNAQYAPKLDIDVKN